MKRLFSALLALLLLLALPAAAWAEEGSVELRTAEDLVRFPGPADRRAIRPAGASC